MPRLHENMSTGERIAVWRVYRGLTQEACAGLCGKSLSWWKKVEAGVRHVERLSDLITIAGVLRIKDLAELTGAVDVGLALDVQRDHPLLPAVRAAMGAQYDPMFGTDRTADQANRPSMAGVRARVERAWEVWRTSPHLYTRVGETLPNLILDALLVREGADRAGQRESAALLCPTYLLAKHFCQKVNAFDLAVIAAERFVECARQADNPLLMALGSWQLLGLYNGLGRPEEALETGLTGAASLQPVLDRGDPPEDYLSLWGSLQLGAALSAARACDDGRAWRLWDNSHQATRALPNGHVHPYTMFCASNVASYTVTIPVELGQAGKAVTASERFDPATLPCAERRARGYIDLARGYAGRRDDVAAVHVLERAERESPEEVAYSTLVHEIVHAMMRRDRKSITGELRGLARRIGMVGPSV
ncbi:MAG TPA: helix-turn-helix domain-containing protein [Mycobacteriales bacterium]|nr:helix-turn-helix domain-containing protein [Mycobacteriales bacterium]